MIVTTKALQSVDIYDASSMRTYRLNSNFDNNQRVDANIDNEDVIFQLSGHYSLSVSENLTNAEIDEKNFYPKWKTNKNGVKENNYKF